MGKDDVLIIAEAGVNHNGDFTLAKKLVDVATEAGADYVKFQTFKSENLVSESAKKAEYQTKNTGSHESQLEMLRKLELSEQQFVELQKYCSTKSTKFLSTGFDLESLTFLKTLNLGLWKIPSGEITNLPYLEMIGKWKEPIILSTGMCELFEIEEALKVLEAAGTPRTEITILHCNTEYPVSPSDIHLKAMETIKKTFGVKVGFSDHSLGIEVALAAVALGATVIEKHFTLDQAMKGPDHKASLEPTELKAMVSGIRKVSQALGSELKVPSPIELKNRAVARKSILAKSFIKQGEIFTKDNLQIKRPGTGISPMKWHQVLGLMAERNFQKDDFIVVEKLR